MKYKYIWDIKVCSHVGYGEMSRYPRASAWSKERLSVVILSTYHTVSTAKIILR
jgi:hypothetical protein